MCKTKEILKNHYRKVHGIQDREIIKEFTGSGFAKRGKTKFKCPIETCPTCGQDYSKNYFFRYHRDRCAEGSISTSRPAYPGFAALIPPAEILAKYSVSKPVETNDEQIKKREETLEKWRKIEQEQRMDQDLHPWKYPKERTPKSKHDMKPTIRKLRKSREKKPKSTIAGHWNEGNNVSDFSDDDNDVDTNVDTNADTPPALLAEDDMEFFREQTNKMLAHHAAETTEKKEEVKSEIPDNFPGCDVKMEEEDDDDDCGDDDDDCGGSTESTPEKEDLSTPDLSDVKQEPSDMNQSIIPAEEGETCNCTMCGKVCHSARQLAGHVRTVHTQQISSCPLCGKELKTIYLRQHLQRQHKLDPKTAKARALDLDIDTLSNVKRPQKRVKSDDNIEVQCPHCPKMFMGRHKLDPHVKNWHNTGDYLCMVCGDKFDLKGKLKNHTAMKHGKPRGGVCHHCSKEVKDINGHISDVHVVKEEISVCCPQCGKSSRNKKYLAFHIATAHADPSKARICQFCSKLCKNSVYLRQHVRLVHETVSSIENYVASV